MTLLDHTPHTLLDHAPEGSAREMRRPALATERLILRAPRPSDAEAVAAQINDRRIADNTARIPHPYTLAHAHEFIAHANGTEREVAFFVTLANGELIGACGIHKLDGKTPELGYWFGVPFWGQGFATEAARAVVDHAFTAMGLDLLTSGARVSNPASRRVLEKCGFQWTGAALLRIRALGASVPADRFRLDRGLWASLKRWGEVTRRV